MILISAMIFLVIARENHLFESTQRLDQFQSNLHNKEMDLNVVGIGDSLTKGVGYEEGGGYAGISTERLKDLSSIQDLSFNNYAIHGDTTEDLLDVLPKDNVREALQQADMIFLSIGGNNLVNVLKKEFLDLQVEDFETKRQDFRQSFNQILVKIRALNHQAPIYFIGLYNPFEDYFGEANAAFQSILEEWNHTCQLILDLYQNTVFIKTEDLFKGSSKDLLSSDHFHPNKKGYQLIADRLMKAILNP